MTSENSDRPRVLKLEGDRSTTSGARLKGARTHPTPDVTRQAVAQACLEGPLAASGAQGMAQDAPGPQAPRGRHEPLVFNQPRMPVVFHQPYVGPIWLAYEYESESCECCGDLYPSECACQIGECFDGCLFDDDKASEDDEEDW